MADIKERIENITGKLKEMVDEEHEKEVADAIIDVLEIIAKRTRNPLDDILLKLIRRWLGVPDND